MFLSVNIVILSACLVQCMMLSVSMAGGDSLARTVHALCAVDNTFPLNKGILAMDESVSTMGARLRSVGVPNTEENRSTFRKLILDTDNLDQYLSGAILSEESLGNERIIEALTRHNVLPGIKVDQGLRRLISGHAGETVTMGLDSLHSRLEEYKQLGAQFCKWRAVFRIPSMGGTPSDLAITENCLQLAQFAREAQEAGLVPLVEPELVMDGCHSIETTFNVQKKIIVALFAALAKYDVVLADMLLKLPFTVPGIDWGVEDVDASDEDGHLAALEHASYTVSLLEQTIPCAIPGIFFLSGGLSDLQSSVLLNAVNCLSSVGPWHLSFSFGRGLQRAALHAWRGEEANRGAAQTAFLRRAEASARAATGLFLADEYAHADGESREHARSKSSGASARSGWHSRPGSDASSGSRSPSALSHSYLPDIIPGSLL